MTRRLARWAIATLLVLALAAAGCSGEPALDLSGEGQDEGELAGDPGAATDGDEPAGATDEDEPTSAARTAEPDPDVDAPEGDPLRIGMATSLSGAIALFGVANQQGAQLAVDQLNDAGGVLGRPVELIVRDDQARPEEGSAQARDLVISEEVDALLGPVSSGVALAITEIARERQVPFITHTANTDALMVEQFHPYMVSVVPNTGMEARAQGVDLADEGFTQWATIAPDYEFGQAQTGTFVDTITAENPDVEIIEQQWPELGESDFQPFISALIGAGPEAVYSPLFASDLVTFTRQAADLGLFDTTYFTALYETDALRELGDEFDLEGVRAYSRCPFTIDTPEMAAFVAAYGERYDEVPSDWACMAYDAVKLWAEVVEDNGTEDADAFAETVGGFSFTSLRGDITIREIDHQASVGSYISELTFSDEHGFYVYASAEPVPAEDIWLDEAAISERRGE
jgi:branched-chain amino acid transport system substrate-binding protein